MLHLPSQPAPAVASGRSVHILAALTISLFKGKGVVTHDGPLNPRLRLLLLQLDRIPTFTPRRSYPCALGSACPAPPAQGTLRQD